MKATRTNRKSASQPPQLAPWLFAIAITALLMAFFMFGFKINPPQTHSAARLTEPESIMIGSWEGADENGAAELLAWSVLGNPEIMSQPHPELGLSILSRHSLPVFFRDVPPFSPSPTATGIEPPRTATPNLIHTVYISDMARGWKSLLPQPERLLQQPLPQQLIWRLADNTMINKPPPIPLEAIREKSQSAPPERSTRLEVQAAGDGIPRYRVRQSSGNSELDLLALRALQARFFGQDPPAADNHRPSEEEPIEVLRLPPPGKTLQVEVEWRLLLPR